jgi:hypothetical protein
MPACARINIDVGSFIVVTKRTVMSPIALCLF